MSANPPGPGDKKGKRMLPSVSDVVRELQGSSTAEPGLLFKSARQVCADELARVKQGFEAAPLEVLVDRARILLDPSLATTPSKDLGGLFDVPAPAAAAAAPEDPFAETTGALDLKWEAPAADAPSSATEILPMDTLKGPGEETLAGLERDAQALELAAAAHQPWRGADVPLATSAPQPPEEPLPTAPYEESRPLFTPPRASSSRSPLLFVVIALALVGAGFGAWRLFSGKVFGGGTPTPAPYAITRRKRPEPTPAAAKSTSVAVAPEATASAPAGSAGKHPSAGATAVPAPTGTPLAIAAARPAWTPVPTPTGAPRATPAPTPTYRLGGGILAAKPPTAGSAAAPPAAPTRAAAVPTAPPAPSRTHPVPTRVAAAGPKFVPKAQPMRSADWSGKTGVYVIHFTSYTDRKPATLDAARLQEKYGRPGHAIQVELGAKGTWYRAVLGDFATVEEAKAFREKLAAEKTPSLGLVYYLTGE